MNKHEKHEIHIINGPFKYESTTHSGKMVCLNCNAFIKWASIDEVIKYEQYQLLRDSRPVDSYEPPLTYQKFYTKTSDWVTGDEKRKIREHFFEQLRKEEKDPTDTIWLTVTFKQKDQAKKLGAQWNHHSKCWYTTLDDKRALDLLEYMVEDDLHRLAKHYKLV